MTGTELVHGVESNSAAEVVASWRHGRMSVTSDRRGVAICTLTGEVDLVATPVVSTELATLETAPDVHAVVLDLSRVTFLAASAAELVADAARRTRSRGREFCVVLTNHANWRAFEITGTAADLLWYDDRSEAVLAAATWTQYRNGVGKPVCPGTN